MLLNKLKEYTIVLASQSPRRKELLKGMGLNFVIEKPVTNEKNPSKLSSVQLVEYLALQKAKAVSSLYDLENSIVIGGDTIVCMDDIVMGKPKTKEDAGNMLNQLSGKKHIVISGLCLIHKHKIAYDHDITHVCFNELSSKEIDYYIKKYEPFDKAGAYGIQEWIGYIGINRIEGSYYNVMGLPTHLLWNMLEEVLK